MRINHVCEADGIILHRLACRLDNYRLIGEVVRAKRHSRCHPVSPTEVPGFLAAERTAILISPRVRPHIGVLGKSLVVTGCQE